MELARTLPTLLLTAWLLPLASFTLIVFFGSRMGKGGRYAGHLAAGAVLVGFVLSVAALTQWLIVHPPGALLHLAAADAEHAQHPGPADRSEGVEPPEHVERAGHAALPPVDPISGDWYTLAAFGSLRLSIGYYIDTLTLAMFCMVTLIGSCIHVYSFGYMHDELGEVTDPLVTGPDGRPLRRRGRYHRFFQYMSLFCFSMLGLVVAGNIAMVFVFWELVGICSYLLIGFYIERRSANNAANKAFIVNRVGDFGMIVGLMVVWTGLGTFSFDDVKGADEGIVEVGIFHQVRPPENDHQLLAPDGMVKLAARREIEGIVREARAAGLSASDGRQAVDAAVAARVPEWRRQGYGYWLLVIAGLGIFCGCVGKSAQFPLHVWLPDAMEGPTPVSALIHAATMVAAGVYLVGRFYPVFAPEVLLVIAVVGCITLFLAATIAITATDIKRVLAYSTVSQLGYMMLALGLGGWLAGIFHLFTHAFFKSLLFLCSGSVIHACGTNEMPQMGGLRKTMPWTAGTMLIGCLAISGAGIPLLIGLSGYYSKDYIVAQALSFHGENPLHGWMFYVAVLGAAITAFYMFRLWYMTFAGAPRDKHVAEHAHESPPVMIGPLVVLAFFAVVVAWNIPLTNVGLEPVLKESRPMGTAEGMAAGRLMPDLVYPPEYRGHELHVPATLWAFSAALVGFGLATLFYGTRKLDAEDARRTFAPIHHFLANRWWFDELYHLVFVRPVLRISEWIAAIDKKGIDWLADHSARLTVAVSWIDDWIDRILVDQLVNLLARWTFAVALRLRRFQTGNLRQYVLCLGVATVTLFLLISLYWNYITTGV
jgi:NADH-quinone oxidoreductase subunit L